MSDSKSPSLGFESTLKEVFDFLTQENVSYFVIGGIAVGILGEPRFTYDLDLDVSEVKNYNFLERASVSPLQKT
jgi:hypothetical protein